MPSGQSWKFCYSKWLNWDHTNAQRNHHKLFEDSNREKDRYPNEVCVAEEDRLFPAGCCLSHVTGEGGVQLDVRLSREQPVPLVSVFSGLSQTLQENMLDFTHHVTAELQVRGGECSLVVPSACLLPPNDWLSRRRHLWATWASLLSPHMMAGTSAVYRQCFCCDASLFLSSGVKLPLGKTKILLVFGTCSRHLQCCQS